MAKDALIGFTSIRRLSFAIDSEAEPEQLATLLKLTERYCIVYQTLSGSPDLSVSSTLQES